MKKLTYFLVLALFVAANASFAQTTPDLTGMWVFDVETDAGSGSPTFVLEQDAEGKISGTYEGQLGESSLTGRAYGEDSGDKAGTFHLEFTIQGALIEYDGKMEGETVSGTVKLGTMASGTFTGKRKES